MLDSLIISYCNQLRITPFMHEDKWITQKGKQGCMHYISLNIKTSRNNGSGFVSILCEQPSMHAS